MAAKAQNFSKMISAQLRNKANEFLNSRKHANNLADILQMFEVSVSLMETYKFDNKNCVIGYVFDYWINLGFSGRH